MLSWLRSEVVTSDGSVLSWANPARPGYAYPEAAGLVLHILARNEGTSDLTLRIAHRLIDSVSDAGAVGRAGIDYVFDTAVALRGLLAFERAGGSLSDERAVERMFEFIVRLSEQRRAVSSGPEGKRWSNGYNPHLLKVVFAIDEWEARTADPRCAPLSARLVETLLPLALSWFDDASRGVPRYVHALCYAAEALHHLSSTGHSEAARGLDVALHVLGGLQRNGALPAWSGRGPEDRLATDATAQAVRLWTAANRTAFAANIDAALAHLASVQHNSGGLTYAPGSDDVNTWCTVFAAQAVEWAVGPNDALI
jgi:hypothetical protein